MAGVLSPMGNAMMMKAGSDFEGIVPPLPPIGVL
jgi:hypothetical protein